jgi:hypothetical protein
MNPEYPETPDCERRSWNTPLRQPWNPVIKQCLNAVDYHVSLYLETGDPWHQEQANSLRQYVAKLKEWIHEQERQSKLNQQL